MSPSMFKYKVFCFSEQSYLFAWLESPPTVCPNDPTHSIDPDSIIEYGSGAVSLTDLVGLTAESVIAVNSPMAFNESLLVSDPSVPDEKLVIRNETANGKQTLKITNDSTVNRNVDLCIYNTNSQPGEVYNNTLSLYASGTPDSENSECLRLVTNNTGTAGIRWTTTGQVPETPKRIVIGDQLEITSAGISFTGPVQMSDSVLIEGSLNMAAGPPDFSGGLNVPSGLVSFDDGTDSTLTETSANAAVTAAGGLVVNKTIVAGLNSHAVHVLQTTFDEEYVLALRNRSNMGYSCIGFYDDVGFSKGSIGWANATASYNPNSMILYSAGNINIDSPVVNIANITNSTAVGTGAFRVQGGASIARSLYVGNTANFAGQVTVPTPTASTSAANKSYVDSVIATAGTGLTKIGTALNINAAQPGITSLGTLTGLTSSGIVTITNTTNSNAVNTGALVVVGGAGIGGNVTIGGNITAATLPTATGHLTNKSYVDSVVVTAGTGLSKTGTALNINPAQPGITSLGTLTGLASSGIVSITNTSNSTLSNNGALVVTGGLGLGGNLVMGGNLTVGGTVTGLTSTGPVIVNDTTNSSSVSTGAMRISGGAGIGGNLNVAGNLSIGGAITSTFSGSLSITDTSSSVSSMTGALLVSGGAGIGKNVSVGGTLTLHGQSTVPVPPTNSDIHIYADDQGNMKSMDSTGKITHFSDILSQKGDMLAFSDTKKSNAIVPVGGPGTFLMADPTSEFGFRWAGTDINNTALDPQSCRFLFITKIADQTLSGGGTYDTISFPTEVWVDRSSFLPSFDGQYIWIREAGTYALMAKLSSSLVNAGSGTVVRWRLLVDDTCTDSNYVEIPFSDVFTTTASGTATYSHDTACMFTVYTCTKPEGVFIKVQAAVFRGSGTMKALGGSCALYFAKMAAGSVAEIYSSTNQTLSTTYNNVFMSASRVVSTPFAYTNGQSSLFFNSTGNVWVDVRITVMKTTGTDPTVVNIRLMDQNNAVIPGTMAGSVPLVSGCQTTIIYSGLLPMTLATGNSFRVQAAIIAGTNVTTIGEACSILALFVPNSTYPTAQLNSVYSVAQPGRTLSSSTWTDVSYTTTRSMITPGLDSTLAAPTVQSSSTSYDITVTRNGIYTVSAVVAATSPTWTTYGRLSSRLLYSVDKGVTYYPLIGSQADQVISANSAVTLLAILQLPVGAQLRVQAMSPGKSDATLSDSCTFSLACYEHITTYLVTSIPFGQYYMYRSSNEAAPFTTTSYFEKLRLSTKYVGPGLYRISLTGSIYGTSTQADYAVKLTAIYANGTSVTIGNFPVSVFKVGTVSFQILRNLWLTAGVHSFVVEGYSSQTGSGSVNDTFLEMWRLY